MKFNVKLRNLRCTKKGNGKFSDRRKGDVMENKLVWQERYNTGSDFIDEEHKKIFGIVNRLIASVETPGGKTQWACQEGIKYFKGYAVRHFEEEEAYMLSKNYSGYETHKRRHDSFRDKTLPALERELTETDYSYEAVRHFIGVCVGWLTGHTMTEDLAIVGKERDKWDKLPPEKEMAALEKTIIHYVQALFKLDVQIVNEHYVGEDFGEKLCYRLVYRSKQDKKKHDIILAFEKRLLLKTTGEMLGMEFEELDDIVIHATRYLAQQFLDNVKKSFPYVERCDIEMESLLSDEDLKMVFDKEYPQYSFLLDTGKGYFAFCVIPDSPHGDLGTPIDAEHAMDQITNFVKKDAKKVTGKILVVDDSRVIRAAMENLFKSDYEVEIADSGVAAIKKITMNKPDLILLDYEMPVCDGRRTLAMIRSEKEFADIPVMFLTGRGDKDSVMNVLSLNPAGYILKTTNYKDIKKNIDYFFEKRAK